MWAKGMERKREEEKILKNKKIIDKLLEVLVETENVTPCDDLLELKKEERKCVKRCDSKSSKKECWLRWAKMKVKNEIGKKDG